MRPVPLVGRVRPQSMRMVVVLPAPLAPRKPKIWPGAMSIETRSTATVGPKVLRNWSRTMIEAGMGAKGESCTGRGGLGRGILPGLQDFAGLTGFSEIYRTWVWVDCPMVPRGCPTGGALRVANAAAMAILPGSAWETDRCFQFRPFASSSGSRGRCTSWGRGGTGRRGSILGRWRAGSYSRRRFSCSGGTRSMPAR